MQSISVHELYQQLQNNTVPLVIDVREPFEHEHENIGGTLIPLNEIIQQAPTLPKNVPIIVYCKKGIRSQIAIQKLEAKYGFTNLFNLDGGIEAWKKHYPTK